MVPIFKGIVYSIMRSTRVLRNNNNYLQSSCLARRVTKKVAKDEYQRNFFQLNTMPTEYSYHKVLSIVLNFFVGIRLSYTVSWENLHNQFTINLFAIVTDYYGGSDCSWNAKEYFVAGTVEILLRINRL